MAGQTMFIVTAFSAGKRGKLVGQPPVQARDEGHARRTAERLSARYVGVIATACEVDAEAESWGEPVVLASYGDVPEMAG
ncbi:hypothetical protein [Castellaniella sp.]|uniref:hypothetical protein n=1 Tax=Castellaniella sp. TaxID=1955812 RepID=UPI002AFF7E85|nr:hypothetical protein [Castellaniella sp.]